MASLTEPWLSSALGVLLVVLGGCGGKDVLVAGEWTDASAKRDGRSEPDAHLEASVDAGFDVAGIDVYVPPCVDQNDCEGAETCQQGVCCAGVLLNGKCTCGHGPGCDLFHLCCTTASSPALAVCASDSYDCCGAFQGPMCEGGP
jgi:hypothetical protein